MVCVLIIIIKRAKTKTESDLVVGIQVNRSTCPSSSTMYDVYTTMGNPDIVERGYIWPTSLLDAKPKSPSRTTSKGLNCLVVRECDLHHNHRTGGEILRRCPSARRFSIDKEKEVTWA